MTEEKVEMTEEKVEMTEEKVEMTEEKVEMTDCARERFFALLRMTAMSDCETEIRQIL